MIFDDSRIYKTLKKILMYVFPAIIYVWGQLVDIWKIPYGMQVSATIFALYVGLAIFLGVSKAKFQNASEGYLADGKGEEDNDAIEFSECSENNYEQ